MDLNAEFPPVLSAFMQSNARRRLIRGPFGSGKSVGCQWELPRRAAMQAPSPRDGKRKTRWAVARNTRPQLRDTTLKTFLEWFPSGSVGVYHSTSNTYFIRQGDIEAEIVFRALDDPSDVRNLLSAEYTGAYFNEQRDIHRDIVEAMDGRIGRYPRDEDGGPTWTGMWGDTNMPTEGTYCWAISENRDPNDYKKKKDNGWEIFTQPAGLIRQVDGSYIENPAAENANHLPPRYYLNTIEGKSDEFIRVYVMCEYGRELGGKPVHPAFNRELHVAKSALIPDKNNLLLVSADFGLTPAIVLVQQNAFGQVLVLEEIVTFGMGIERAIEEKLLPLMRRRFDGFEVAVTGDPSGGTGSQADETSCADIFRRYKRKGLGSVRLAYSNSPVHRQGALDHFLTRLVDNGKPAFLIDPRCEWLIAALSGKYAFKKLKNGMESSDVEKSDWSHVAEALEYSCMHFERGGRRKAELKERSTIIAPPDRNIYAIPR